MRFFLNATAHRLFDPTNVTPVHLPAVLAPLYARSRLTSPPTARGSMRGTFIHVDEIYPCIHNLFRVGSSPVSVAENTFALIASLL